MAVAGGGQALQRVKAGGSQHSGVQSFVGHSPFCHTDVFIACETSPGSSFGAGASTETCGRLLVTSAGGTAPAMLSPGRVSAGGCGAGWRGEQPRSRAPRLSPRQEINN